MTAAPQQTFTCIACGQQRAATLQMRYHNRASRVCWYCHQARQRLRDEKRSRLVRHGAVEPRKPKAKNPSYCSFCALLLKTHWRCRRCGALGHLTGRSHIDLTLCAYCETEVTR